MRNWSSKSIVAGGAGDVERPPFFQRPRRPHNGMAVACTRAFNPPSGEGLSVFTQASVREAALAGTVTWT
jgi:hypothetical protein